MLSVLLGDYVMPEIIFESSDIIFEKTSYKNGRCKVAVKNRASGYVDMTYRYRDVPGVESQYISWENLSHCAEWNGDESYLHTAVQHGKKLLASASISTYNADFAQNQLEKFGRKCLVESEGRALMQMLRDELPSDCVFVKEKPELLHPIGLIIYFDICKIGTIADYFDLDAVFAAYDRLGLQIFQDAADYIRQLCGLPIEIYASSSAPFRYYDSNNVVQLFVTGLLLGYPIESTTYLIEANRLFPVKK
jgi:hypothetical protein